MTDETKIDTSSAVKAYLGQQTDPALEAQRSFTMSVGTNPDYEVELRRVSAATGVPVDSARAYPDEVKRKAKTQAVNFQGMLDRYPTTVRFMADQKNAQVAHDDVTGLQGVEDTLKPTDRSFLEGIWQPIASGWKSTVSAFGLTLGDTFVPKGLEAKRQMVAEQAGIDYAPSIERAVKQAQLERTAQKYPAPESIQQGMQEISGAQTMGDALEAALSNPRATLEVALQSIGASAPGLLLAGAGTAAGPLGTAAGAGTGSFVVEYASTVRDVMSDAGINMTDPQSLASGLKDAELMAAAREKALKRGIPIAAFDAITAGVAGKLLSGARATAASVAPRVAGELAVQAGGGAAGEATAQAVTGDYKPGDILMEALAEIPTSFVEVPGNYRHALRKAQQAEQQAAYVEQVTQSAKASKLAGRDVDTFEQFVAQAKEEGPVQDVYIDAQTLMQSGVADQVAAVSPAVADQLPAAAATGGVIRIPVEEYAARIAPTDLSQSLLDHLRTEPDGFSRTEAQQFMQTQQEQLQAEMERVAAAQESDTNFKTQRDTIAAQVRDQLDAVGRFSPEVHNAYATLVGNFFAVQGAKLGVSPQELFDRTGLNVAGSMAEGPQLEAAGAQQPLEQGQTLRELTRQLRETGLSAAATERNGTINLAEIVVPEAERGSGKGTAAMYRPAQPAKTLEQKARGTFNPDTNTITLLKSADLSTFLHESGHFFLEQQLAMTEQLRASGAELTPAQQEMAKDTQALLDWFGVKDLQTWYGMDFEEQRGFHEKFAQGFEKYLFEGKAPSIELQSLFQRFAAWLKSIYRDLTRLGVQLTPEVRGVFDRMLATNEQIATAEQARGMMPLFDTPEKAGMTEDEFRAYQAQDVQASADAIQEMQARGLRDMQFASNARGREIKRLQKEAKAAREEIRMEVAKQVMAEPVYQAWQFLTGKPSGEETAVNYGKLDLETLRAAVEPLVFERLKQRRMTGKDGLHPDVVAEKFGYASGDEMTQALAMTSSPSEEIEGITDRVMLERYGELASPEAIEKAADRAIHNSVRARVLATEANALAKLTGQRKVLLSAAKELASKIVGRLKIVDLRPQLYVTAEGKAGRAADTAFRKGEVEQAAAQKRNQLINHELARTAFAAQDEAIKIDRFFKRIASLPDDKLKGRDMDVVNAARTVLAAYGYGAKAKAKNAAKYLKKVQEYDPAMYEVLADSVVAALEIAEGDVKQLTMDQLRTLNDEVSSLWYLSKRVRQMEIDGDLMDREDIAEQLQNRMQEIGLPSQMPGKTSAVTPDEERAMKIASVKAITRRVESWVDMLDGKNKLGPFRRYLWTPIKEAAYQYRADRVGYLRQFRDSFSAIAPTMKRGKIVAPELNYTFGKDSGGVAMNEILHAVLHTGNESNKRKLLLGRDWAQEQPDGTLDTSRWDSFVKRLVAEGKLTREHFDFAQKVWDLLEQTKPLAQKAHRAAYGKYFDEVTAESFTDPFGVVRRGGYVPAQVDSRIVEDNQLKKLIEEGKDGMAYAFPGTSKGFTKARVEYNRPLLLDLRTLPQHIDKVLLFSHMEMPSRDAAKLLYTKGLSASLNRLDPAAITGMLMPWLNRSARQQVTTPIAGAGWMMRMLNTLRNRTSMATMFANISNTAQQITGFSLAALKVKPTSLAAATADYLRHPKRTAEEVAELSVFMRNRMSNEVDAMLGDIQGILLDPSLYEKAQEWTARHTYFLQTAFDNVMGPIIWRAAYSEALEQNFDTKDAVRIADATIRQTQGSTMPEDVSRIETGPAYARLFTQFVGYFNMQANLLGTEFAKVSQEMGLRKGMGKGLYITLLGFYAPAVIAELVAQAFRGGPGDDDNDGDYLDDWLMATLVYGPMRNATAFVPFAGQVINSAVARFNGNPNDDRMSLSPAVSSIEAAVGAPYDIYKASIGEGNAQRTAKDVATLISLTTGLPASVAARPISYLAGVEQRTVQPTSAPDLVRGLVTGAASPESKQR